MNDQLSALRLFVRVARAGSFSRAARELGIAQPSASRIVAALEHELGVALFTRTTRALALTEAGRAYLERVEPLLGALDQADHEIRGSGELRGTLRVGLSSSLGVRAVIPALPRFAQPHPELQIELLMDDRRQDLVLEGVDVALRFGAMADSTAVARRIGSWPRVVAASPAYLASAGWPTIPQDLAGHAAILGRGGPTDWTFSRDGAAVAVRVDGRIRASQNEGAIAAAVAGLGVVSTTQAACRRELDAGVLVRLLPEWSLGHIDVHAVFAGGRAATPAARAFAEFLVDVLREFAG